MRYSLAKIGSLLAAVLFVCATGHAQDRAGIELFEKRIRPLLAAHCYECHGPKTQESELRLDGYAGMISGGASGAAVVPGKPQASLLITAVRYVDDDLQMPPEGKLPASQIADLVRWIESGAPHPEAGSPPARVRVDSEDAAAANHWAFQPLRSPALPRLEVDSAPRPRTPIDVFVLAKLQEAGLSPAPGADKRTLIRRATFDLLGLPPTPAEVEAFLADDSPDAFAKVVDRLLSSPRYGERWGRHWLDVVRYADSNGLDENLAHGNAWRYRDYVIASLNADKPYDAFVREQLAGDLLPTDDPQLRNERLIATGFLALGPKVLAEVDERKMEMDIIDEQIDTVGKSLLGLTLGCARCHDHKFDPIAMTDYYALAGIFKSTRTMDSFKKIASWHENPLASEEYRREKARHDRLVGQQEKALADAVAQANAALQSELGAGAALPAKPEESYPQVTRDELEKLREKIAALKKNPPQPPTAMGVTEGQITNVPVHVRGSHLTLGRRVPRGFPEALVRDDATGIAAGSSGRRELAAWLTQPDHPLTARVMVNRVWRWHFGQGLIATPNNFGRLGAPPVNPALLDWLAAQFVRDGWSIKALHRRIMLSATYQLSSRHDARAARIDPENRLHWRANVRRLEAEALRDSLLAVAGQIDLAMGGSLMNTPNRKHIFDHTSKDDTTYDSRRRSVYLPVVRNHLHDALTLFDYTDASLPNGNRNSSTVAPQALYLMNSDFVARMSGHVADRLLAMNAANDEARVRAFFEIAYGRPAAEDELNTALAFIDRFEKQLAQGQPQPDSGKPQPGDARRREARRLLCQTLLMANEFIHVR